LVIELVQASLYHAESLDIRTLAIPSLGEGIGGANQKVVLDTVFATVCQHLQRGATPLRRVKMVLHDDAGAIRDAQTSGKTLPTPDVVTYECPLARRANKNP
jgi:O-acetyl-ADP-ribose deacetylase (regulator of RNase III)